LTKFCWLAVHPAKVSLPIASRLQGRMNAEIFLKLSVELLPAFNPTRF
tara:strand:+ start:14659 stop:14802 length:144 start_codon:yes stop_codon:yes gene_type:complete